MFYKNEETQFQSVQKLNFYEITLHLYFSHDVEIFRLRNLDASGI